ncbi:hypothetical protein [uncultured Jannaschia sp.]|uniref:hypothetical protein n=1 Tax=uncultured Jannaschia sp. TaxID=293347 RepID=UPI002634AFD2|nr:hypothetical protein [uncultured Jannaschia sp.]
MDIAIHLGAHCTDEDLILRTLSRNADVLATRGVVVPPGARVRPAIRRVFAARPDDAFPPNAEPLRDSLLDGTRARRMVLSYEGFLSTYATALEGPDLYPEADARTALLQDVFPRDRVAFFLAIRNPATHVPALFEASSFEDFGDFLDGVDLASLRWSAVVDAIRAVCSDAALTVWCNEDLPLIWPEILRAVSGVDIPLAGEDAILRQVMTSEGFRSFEAYLKDNPTADRSTWRKTASAFLVRHADAAQIEPEIAQPDWSEEMIAGLSNLYEADVARIRARDDVTFLAP